MQIGGPVKLQGMCNPLAVITKPQYFDFSDQIQGCLFDPIITFTFFASLTVRPPSHPAASVDAAEAAGAGTSAACASSAERPHMTVKNSQIYETDHIFILTYIYIYSFCVDQPSSQKECLSRPNGTL